MKILVVSDIHGSNYYMDKIIEIYNKEKADRIILLGDLYYHGPRNPLPKDYNPMEVSKKLNSMKEIIRSVKGNCDAEVDEMISEFELENMIKEEINGKKIIFTHGHKNNIDKPIEDADILVYGHFHTCFIKEKDGIIYVNPGSISLPKNDTPNSYLLIEDNKLIIKDVYMNVITEQTI